MVPVYIDKLAVAEHSTKMKDIRSCSKTPWNVKATVTEDDYQNNPLKSD